MFNNTTRYAMAMGVAVLVLVPMLAFSQQTTAPAPPAGTHTNAPAKEPVKVPEVVTVNGKLSMKETPGKSPSDQPTKSYSITVTDAKGINGKEFASLKGKTVELPASDAAKASPLVGKEVVATGTLSADNHMLTASTIREYVAPKKPAA